MKSDHPTTPVICPWDDRPRDIDTEIVPLIKLLWQIGVRTTQSCQNMNGYVWLVLTGTSDLRTLLAAVGDPQNPLYADLWDEEVAAPYWPGNAPWRKTMWRYSIGPYPHGGGADTWPDTWDFCVTVEFVCSQLPAVVTQLQRYADWLDD